MRGHGRWKGLILLSLTGLLTASTSGCGSSGEQVSRAGHDDSAPSTSPAGRLGALKALLRERPSKSIGVLNGMGPDLFGTIRSVVVGVEGDLVLLDSDALELKWFGADGSFRGSAGRGGEGPGEFRAPVAIAPGDGDRIHVLDGTLQRITTFEKSDSGLAYVRVVNVGFFASDLCVLEGKMFLLAPSDSLVVKEVGPGGDVLAEFAPRLEVRDNPDVARLWERPAAVKVFQQWQNQGLLLCSSSPPRIVIVPRSVPWMRAFRPTGEAVWRSELSNFRRVHHTNPYGNAIAFGPDPSSGTSHSLLSVSRLGREWFAATYRELGPGPREESLEIRVVSLIDGREQGTISDPDFAISGTSPRLRVVVAFTNLPYPRVGIFEAKELEWLW